MHRPRRRGFSLVEVMIVVTCLAILALIAIPYCLNAARSAREARLRSDLQELRLATELFRAHTGGYPLQLSVLMRTRAPRTALVPPTGRPIRLLPQSYRGPYLVTADGRLPRDPMTGQRDWVYRPWTGRVRSRSDDQALDGTDYSDW